MIDTSAKISLVARDVRKSFRRATGEVVQALDDVSLQANQGALTALVGPDGAGKTTLIRLAAGLMVPDAGELTVLGLDAREHPQEIQNRIGYMPQKFGLYEDLSVQENLDLYADLHGVGAQQRREQYSRLMQMTALGPFRDRLAGQLSGGMKQKLGLSCTLVRTPELLLLDEPTVGVDPLSRRELWDIILHLVDDQGLTVMLSTSYLDEAERCGHVVVLHSGKVLAQGRPAEIAAIAGHHVFIADPPAGRTARTFQARLLDDPGVIDAVPEAGRVRLVRTAGGDAGDGVLSTARIAPIEPRFEDGFMMLLKRTAGGQESAAVTLPEQPPTLTQTLSLTNETVDFMICSPLSFKERGARGVRSRAFAKKSLFPLGIKIARERYFHAEREKRFAIGTARDLTPNPFPQKGRGFRNDKIDSLHP